MTFNLTSWKIAEMKKTTVCPVNLLYPCLNMGLYTCLKTNNQHLIITPKLHIIDQQIDQAFENCQLQGLCRVA